MRAFRSAGSIFKRLTGARPGGNSAAAEEPKVKVEYDISPSHPKNVIRFCIHPEDEQRTKKMMAANPPGIMDWLSHVNIIAATADLFWKSGRALFKAKESGVKEALKGEGCCFGPQSQRHLSSLFRQSSENTTRLEYLELVAEHYAKYGLAKGSPPPPLRPPAPSKQGNGNSNGKGKGDGDGDGSGKGNGNGNSNGKGKGDGDGDGSGKGNGNGNSNGKGNGGGDGNGNGSGNGNSNGYGNGGPPALSENGTLPEPFEYPF
ncbi:ABC transporter C family member 4-like [Pyrus ussuriensis x Pyrus communis]|uniref:ABC transporter C family member 4-like n=1 Tax=Pyrus ussuriensis x Pyrus communis TaxID=2448454 RepID=A0A5N5FVA6_9ROSA|nr:ABC transporter C family member 4-like [Pyrus ussuriensis x Pyrus communis]